MINFENIQDKLKEVSSSKEWKKLIEAVNCSKRVYIIGNVSNFGNAFSFL